MDSFWQGSATIGIAFEVIRWVCFKAKTAYGHW